MKVSKFNDYLTEQIRDRDDKNVTVAVVTSKYNLRRAKGRKELTTDFIISACKKLNIPCHIIQTKSSYIADKDIDSKSFVVHNIDGHKTNQKFIGPNTVCFVRRGAMVDETGKALVTTFEDAGSYMVNNREAMIYCDNKLMSNMMFERENIQTPRTSYVANEYSIPKAVEAIGGKFPVIIKTITGTQGIGVTKADDYDTLVSTLQAMWKFDAEMIIQEYFDIEFDVRTIVMADKIIAATKREKVKGEFRSNMHRTEKKGVPYTLNDVEKEIVLKASRATTGELIGVDHILDKKGNPLVLEVNGSPGTGADYEGYMYSDNKTSPEGKMNGEAIVLKFIKYFTNRNNWDKKSIYECGWAESVHIDGIGDVRAKLDTGNGTKASTLHAENIKVENGNVKWEYDGKKYMAKHRGNVDVHRADPNFDIDSRPLVFMKIKFNNTIHGDVPVALDLRKKSYSDLLINRELLKRMAVSVNPGRMFVLSKKIEVSDKANRTTTDMEFIRLD